MWIYGPFGECSVTCGGGIKRSFPEVVTPAMNGGSCNLPEPKEMTCNTQSCPGKHSVHYLATCFLEFHCSLLYIHVHDT